MYDKKNSFKNQYLESHLNFKKKLNKKLKNLCNSK